MHFQYGKLTVPVQKNDLLLRKKKFHIRNLTFQFGLFDLNRVKSNLLSGKWKILIGFLFWKRKDE